MTKNIVKESIEHLNAMRLAQAYETKHQAILKAESNRITYEKAWQQVVGSPLQENQVACDEAMEASKAANAEAALREVEWLDIFYLKWIAEPERLLEQFNNTVVVDEFRQQASAALGRARHDFSVKDWANTQGYCHTWRNAMSCKYKAY